MDSHGSRGAVVARAQEVVLADRVAEIATESGFEIIDDAIVPGAPARIREVPTELDGRVADVLRARWPQGIYSHQAEAVSALLSGNDLTLATPTASGKSAVFMSCAAHYLLKGSHLKTLALYPAKALIHDQLAKWQDFGGALGINTAYIHGGIKMDERPGILADSQVVLMTPDVAHAWLLRRLELPEVRAFLRNLRLLILDEAHEYEGVFGTNMAFLLRRLQVASRAHSMIVSTATIAAPGDFIEKLSGRETVVLGAESDGSPRPEKKILLARTPRSSRFNDVLSLLRKLSAREGGRFLAFADSRKMVERVVSGVHRFGEQEAESGAVSDVAEAVQTADGAIAETRHDGNRQRVLPYRAGYEEKDRQTIQQALESGELAGVVSTSALELGLDIGDIDLVILLSQPPSLKSFWQRVGRAGRRETGVCLFLDNKGVISDREGGLQEYLARPLEPSWLYLENRIIQYSHALCAAQELSQLGNVNRSPLESLPLGFARMLENELNPTEAVPHDLYALKQRGEATPHLTFPLRAAAEPNFQVLGIKGEPLGSVSLSQALREAYPGAIYYYMARPHRVLRMDEFRGEITCKWEKRLSTEPISQAMVFPRFEGGTFQLLRSPEMFVAESELQVSERVQGFFEIRGNKREEHKYGVGSPYRQRDLNRFFPTTGVCWSYPGMTAGPVVSALLLEAFASEFGIQTRDLGVGTFLDKNGGPLGADGECRGWCIYDSAQGSLRLTELLATHFVQVSEAALELAHADESFTAAAEVERLLGYVSALAESDPATTGTSLDNEGDWYTVVLAGEPAMYTSKAGSEEVQVKGYRFTPAGLMYELKSKGEVTRLVKWETIQPLHGRTRMARFNAMTGETQEL